METARAALPLHRAVADAIIGRDVEGARRALSRLITSARQDIIGALPELETEEASHEDGDRISDPLP
jgi:DNA-binding FadR family transcriptional regulator